MEEDPHTTQQKPSPDDVPIKTIGSDEKKNKKRERYARNSGLAQFVEEEEDDVMLEAPDDDQGKRLPLLDIADIESPADMAKEALRRYDYLEKRHKNNPVMLSWLETQRKKMETFKDVFERCRIKRHVGDEKPVARCFDADGNELPPIPGPASLAPEGSS